jgi:hypothetical protein
MQLPRPFWLLLIAFSVPLPFLFLKQLAPGGTLWLQRVWDVGHVPLFAIWMIIAVRLMPLPLSAIYVAARALGLFGAAVAIEYIQDHTGRQFSLLDMYLDAGGIAVGARLSVPALRQLPPVPRSCLDLLLAILIAIGLRDAGKFLFDRIYMEVQFPQLWNASQPLPALRFANADRYVIVDNANTGNQPALQMNFTTTEYSMLDLLEMKSDWRAFSTLNIDVMNPAPTAFDVTCRVNDAAHFANGGMVDDRFNRLFTLRSGWNRLSINLVDIESAPAHRKMQMDQINGLGCFTKKLKEPRPAYFRAIWLDR